ncbi:MAG: Eco57I restriction-modification methylase domain-containing protein [Candidatus Hodarchaeales archaeon]|jgi:methylase of polypeptide subunit release factors
MILPPELSNIEKDFITKNLNLVDNSKVNREKQLLKFLGEIFFTLLASKLMTPTNLTDLTQRYAHSKSVISFTDLFHQIIDLSDIISEDDQIISQMQQFFDSHENIKSVTVNLGVITSNLANYPFQLEEELSKDHLTPQLLSIITEFSPLMFMKKKKTGKYYTLPNDAALISLLVVFRFLKEKSSYSDGDKIIDFLFEDNVDLSYINQIKSNKPTEIRILDPACGSGTFIIQLTRLLCKLGPITESVIRIYVDTVDLDPLALLVTRLRFFLLELFCFIHYGSSRIQLEINISREDFLVENNQLKYDIIIGNPPFVRHEDIGSDNIANYKKDLIDKFLMETEPQVVFDKKSDLYVYFCLKSLKLLKNTGVLGFLTSNAWLEVKYGKTLQNYLITLLTKNELAKCEIIYQAGARLWKQIGVNSIVFLATRNLTSQSQTEGVFFTESNSILTQIPTCELKKNMLFSREATSVNCRTEFIPSSELSQTHKWAGSFLRASKDERRVLKKLMSQGVQMHSIADVRFGIKSGANDFFHLVGNEDEKNQYIEIHNKRNYSGLIESRFLVPLIKSPSEIDNFAVTSEFTKKNWLFYCQVPKDRIKGTFALKYIQWGEKEVIPIKQGRKMGSNVKGFASLASISDRELWYSISQYPVPQLLWAKSYHDKPGCFMNQEKFYPDQRFYSIYPNKENDIPLLFTYLNSSFAWALMEQAGNTNMGLGVLDTNVYWLKTLTIPRLMSSEQLEEIKSLARELKETYRREPITSESVIRGKIDEFFKGLFRLRESEFRVIENFIKKSIRRRLASNESVTKDN